MASCGAAVGQRVRWSGNENSSLRLRATADAHLRLDVDNEEFWVPTALSLRCRELLVLVLHAQRRLFSTQAKHLLKT